MDFYLGQIMLWPIQFPPQGWALCDGSQMSINQNAALYSLLGAKFGGDGSTYFKLPDLRNRVPLGAASLSQIGIYGGSATSTQNAVGAGQITLTANNLPTHNHPATFTPGTSSPVNVTVNVSQANGADIPPAAGDLLAVPCTPGRPAVQYAGYVPAASAGTTVALGGVSVSGGGATGTVTVGNTGSGQPASFNVAVPVAVSTMQPSLTMNFFICIEGVYPVRQ